MTNHPNDERTVRCPVDGCDAEKLARGIHLHVRQSSGDGHGPQGEVPDSINFENLDTVGEQTVEMDYPEERNNEKEARLCPYCSQTFAGEQGLMIHLGQTAGRKNHPEDPTDIHDPEDFPRVEVDDAGNVQTVADAAEMDPSDDIEKGTVPVSHVFRLIADLVADGETQTAQRIRRALLGADHADRPLSKSPPGPELYDALLRQVHEEDPDSEVSAALEAEGIMVACRGESAFYDAEAALDVAAGLENATSPEQRSKEITDLIEFLRYGADVLKAGDTDSTLHEEFNGWR